MRPDGARDHGKHPRGWILKTLRTESAVQSQARCQSKAVVSGFHVPTDMQTTRRAAFVTSGNYRQRLKLLERCLRITA